jgi:short-subunit dehydrogenase
MATNYQPPGSVVVTGASSGIGAVYADRLARRGCGLILVARDEGRLEVLADRLRQVCRQPVEVFVSDLADRAQSARLETRLRDDDTIGGLINNAGVGLLGPLVGSDPAQIEAALQLNVLAFTRLASAAASAFVSRQAGLIVNIASGLAFASERANPVYAASKAYVLTFTQSLHAQIGQHGVRLQVVLPGATRTEIFDRAGGSVNNVPEDMLMETADLVDAALAGLDQGELVTIPSLPDAAAWEELDRARILVGRDVSHKRPADRYRLGQSTPS